MQLQDKPPSCSLPAVKFRNFSPFTTQELNQKLTFLPILLLWRACFCGQELVGVLQGWLTAGDWLLCLLHRMGSFSQAGNNIVGDHRRSQWFLGWDLGSPELGPGQAALMPLAISPQ